MTGQPFPPDVELTAAQRSDLELLLPPSGVEPLHERRVGRYRVRNLMRNEVPVALELFREVLDYEFSEASWDWRHYARNPGMIHMPAAFDEEDRLVGLYPCTLRPARALGRDFITCHACRTLTHPDHRGGGRVFALMSRFTVDRCYSIGAHFGYGGGANEAALKVGRRLIGYRVMHRLPIRERRLSMRLALQDRLGRAAGSAAARLLDATGRLRREATGAYRVEKVSRAGEAFDDLWRRKRDRYRVLIRRDGREVNWRYLRCPVDTPVLAAWKEGALEGYAAIRHFTDREGGARITQVLDLFTGGSEAAAAALLARAAEAGTEAGSDFLHFAPAPGSAGWAIAERPPWRPSRKAADIVIVRDLCNDPARVGLEEVIATVVEGRNWFYCQGDSDFWD